VSLAQNVPGPVAIARLVAAGARATKVEPPGGDPLRALSPSWHAELHRGVRVLEIDLKAERGFARFSRLLDKADVLLTSQRPAALTRLGIDREAIAGRFPHLRWLNVVGELTRPDVAGHDLTYQAEAGLLGAEMPPTLLADLVGAERIVSEALLLIRRPPPAFASVGLRDALDTLVAPRRHRVTTPGGVLGGGLPTYAVYAARTGHVAIGALEPHFQARLYGALGLPDRSPLAAIMRTRSAADWQRWARARDIPLVKVIRGAARR
jgi:crotonobetainyl-CoA:carnitine CoA-transferase CaiB-like acyl-CoA transferase